MAASTLFIINPISGTHGKEYIAGRIAAYFGNEARICYTKAPGHATELAREALTHPQIEKIVAVGGDGTINEVATAMIHSAKPLGIIPCGSGNGLARHLHIPLQPAHAIRVTRYGHPLRCDTASSCGRPFFCTMGVGFDAGVSKAFADAPTRGLLTYARIAVEQFFTYQPQTYHITTDTESFSIAAYLIAACNASQYGNNAYIAPRADITDGLLDLTIITEGNHSALALAGLRLFTKGIEHCSLTRSLRARHITIERESPGAAHLDGEALQMPERIDIDVVPASISIIVE